MDHPEGADETDDALSLPPKRASWLGPLFVLVVVALTLGYLLV